MAPEVVRQSELSAVQYRRAELREAMGGVERALASAAIGRPERWADAVHDAIAELSEDFRAHIEVTEAVPGLHSDIVAASPRLTHAVARLAAEHPQIADGIKRLVLRLRDPVTDADIDELRNEANTLLGNLVRHRQRGADLIYEAFEYDIGAGD